MVTVCSIAAALFVGAIIMIVMTPQVIDVWKHLFSNPGLAVSSSWRLVYGAYESLLAGSLGTPAGYA